MKNRVESQLSLITAKKQVIVQVKIQVMIHLTIFSWDVPSPEKTVLSNSPLALYVSRRRA